MRTPIGVTPIFSPAIPQFQGIPWIRPVNCFLFYDAQWPSTSHGLSTYSKNTAARIRTDEVLARPARQERRERRVPYVYGDEREIIRCRTPFLSSRLLVGRRIWFVAFVGSLYYFRPRMRFERNCVFGDFDQTDTRRSGARVLWGEFGALL